MFNGSEWEAPKRSVEFEIEATLNMAYHHGRRARIEDYLLMLINRKPIIPYYCLRVKPKIRIADK